MAMSEAHKKALAEGRRKAARKRRAEALEIAQRRVTAFQDWCRLSAEHMSRERALERAGHGEAEIRAKIGPMPRMSDDAAAVTDNDYDLVRGDA